MKNKTYSYTENDIIIAWIVEFINRSLTLIFN